MRRRRSWRVRGSSFVATMLLVSPVFGAPPVEPAGPGAEDAPGVPSMPEPELVEIRHDDDLELARARADARARETGAADGQQAPPTVEASTTPAGDGEGDGDGDGDGAAADPGRVRVDGKHVGDVDDIEDLGLEGLLGMDLGEQLGTTEATSAKEEDVLRAPSTLTTIDAEEIRLSGVTSIPDLLRRVPGLQVTRAAAGNDVVAIRGAGGLANNNLVVLVDGTPITSPVDGSIDWDLVPLGVAEVERIEVVRGPVSPVYGANAYTGVVNIVTREAIGITPSWHARMLGGVDTEAAPLVSGSGSVVHVGERLSGKWLINAGYDDTYNDIPEETGRHPANLRFGTVGMLEGSFGERGYFRGEIGGSYSERSGLDLLVRESERTRRFLGFGSFALGWRDLPGKTENVEIWVRDRAHLIDTDPDDYVGINYAGTRSNRTELGVEANFLLTKKWELHASISGLLDWLEAPYINAGSQTLFPGFGYRIGTTVMPNERWDLSFDLRGDAPPTVGLPIHSARMTGVYHRDTWALRVSAGSSFRAPTYVEVAGRFVDPTTGFVSIEGNPDLRPPVNGTVEIGAIFSPRTGLTLAPTVYYSGLYNAVVTDFGNIAGKSFVQDNTSRDTVGEEFELRWRQSDAFVLSVAFGSQYFLGVADDEAATIAVPEQNSAGTASTRVYGVALNEKLGYGAGVRLATARRYRGLVGIPPRQIDIKVPTTADLDAMVEYRLPDKFPLWLSLRARSFLMPGVVEAPFVQAAPRGTSFLLGLEFRGR